jgi:hypothetical protein
VHFKQIGMPLWDISNTLISALSILIFEANSMPVISAKERVVKSKSIFPLNSFEREGNGQQSVSR